MKIHCMHKMYICSSAYFICCHDDNKKPHFNKKNTTVIQCGKIHKFV